MKLCDLELILDLNTINKKQYRIIQNYIDKKFHNDQITRVMRTELYRHINSIKGF